MIKKTEHQKKEQPKIPYMAVGRRKVARARVYLYPGEGKITVNDRSFENYFPREVHRIIIMQPLKTLKQEKSYDIFLNVDGGGVSGQAEAARHGIARALLKVDISSRAVLKKAKFLTRDPRAKERKKYGRKRARKRFQFSKR